MLIVGIAEEAKQRSLGPEILIQLIPYILPRALMFAMPATCLFSVCVVFGRMAADNEIVAVKSMGLHQSVIVFPVLAVAFLLSLTAVWVNDVSFAWSYWGIERVVLESSDQILYSVLKDQGRFKTNKFSIEVDGVEGRRLIRPVINTYSATKQFRAVAEEATLTTDINSHSLKFEMIRGAVLLDGKQKSMFQFDEYSHPIPLKSPEEVSKATGNPSHLYLSQISSEIDTQTDNLSGQNQANTIRACSQLLAGDMLGLTNADWRRRVKTQKDSTNRLSRLHVVPHRRWANGFSCLAFAMIGIPIALRMKTANYATTFGVCFLPILAVYYPLFMFGLNGAKVGHLPAYAAWLGNVVCLMIGAFLLWREFKR
jgi:lipopolysaccharide export system permease protein